MDAIAVTLDRKQERPVEGNREASRPQWWRDECKRWFECALAVLLLLLLAPVLMLLACVIKVSAGGPVIYRRRVAGRDGPFDAFKFRTMVLEAEQILEQDARLWESFSVNWKLSADPRVTPLGRVLRKYSIDELPQLLNVVRGEMALIGPRMVTVAELERYGDLAPKLLSVRPGLTGLWQVSGRQTVSYERRIALDMEYIERCSLAFDVAILARTVPVVLGAEGAY